MIIFISFPTRLRGNRQEQTRRCAQTRRWHIGIKCRKCVKFWVMLRRKVWGFTFSPRRCGPVREPAQAWEIPAEGLDPTPDTTCWSRISAIIAGRPSYINHKKPELGKPRPPNTNHIHGYKNGIIFSASFISPASFSPPPPPTSSTFLTPRKPASRPGDFGGKRGSSSD